MVCRSSNRLWSILIGCHAWLLYTESAGMLGAYLSNHGGSSSEGLICWDTDGVNIVLVSGITSCCRRAAPWLARDEPHNLVQDIHTYRIAGLGWFSQDVAERQIERRQCGFLRGRRPITDAPRHMYEYLERDLACLHVFGYRVPWRVPTYSVPVLGASETGRLSSGQGAVQRRSMCPYAMCHVPMRPCVAM